MYDQFHLEARYSKTRNLDFLWVNIQEIFVLLFAGFYEALLHYLEVMPYN